MYCTPLSVQPVLQHGLLSHRAAHESRTLYISFVVVYFVKARPFGHVFPFFIRWGTPSLPQSWEELFPFQLYLLFPRIPEKLPVGDKDQSELRDLGCTRPAARGRTERNVRVPGSTYDQGLQPSDLEHRHTSVTLHTQRLTDVLRLPQNVPSYHIYHSNLLVFHLVGNRMSSVGYQDLCILKGPRFHHKSNMLYMFSE